MKHRVITDPDLGLTLGVDGRLARITWGGGSYHVEAEALCLGRWIKADVSGQLSPPAHIVCRATALAVGAWIKEGVLHALEELP